MPACYTRPDNKGDWPSQANHSHVGKTSRTWPGAPRANEQHPGRRQHGRVRRGEPDTSPSVGRPLGQCVGVDLTNVTFFSSAGVAALATFSTTCQADVIVLRVVSTLAIDQVLSITGADQVLQWVHTAEAALADIPI